jgi:hypothetical protein
LDKKAKGILFKTYWSSSGWKDDKTTALSDFAYAKEKGLMFDPLSISHDDCVNRIIDIVNAITLDQVSKAFLSSLSTRRLDWRSGIGSYNIAKLFTPHKYTPVESGHSYKDGKVVHTSYTCKVCQNLNYGVVGHECYINEDLNVLNFERIKWGGVRHGNLIYTLFDLEQFAKECIPEPTETDIEILKSILSTIASCNPGDSPSLLRDKLNDVPDLKSSKDERSIIIEILACIEVLKPMFYDRRTASKNDWTYAEFWRGEDGYNTESVGKYFGKYLGKWQI